ncbi:hypothetical protein GQ457_13G006810 [Hibiscus cannabinus]
MLFMQPQPPPPKKRKRYLCKRRRKKRKRKRKLRNHYFVRSPRSNNKDGNAELERGGQFGLNNTPQESTRPPESA